MSAVIAGAEAPYETGVRAMGVLALLSCQVASRRSPLRPVVESPPAPGVLLNRVRSRSPMVRTGAVGALPRHRRVACEEISIRVAQVGRLNAL